MLELDRVRAVQLSITTARLALGRADRTAERGAAPILKLRRE